MDEIENQLRELGKRPAFEVDWSQYERDLVERLLRKERQQTRTYWAVALGGMVAGVAATVLLTAVLSRTPNTPELETVKSNSTAVAKPTKAIPPTQPAQPALHNAPTKLVREKSKPGSILYPAPVETASLPGLQTIKRPDGKTGFIRFIGFSENPQAPEIIQLPGQPPKRVG